MKKDVLILSQFFYPEYITSATLPYETAVDLSKHGLSVDVLCGYPKNYNTEKDIPSKETVKNVNITRINYPNFNKNTFLGRLLNYFAFTVSMLLNIMRLKNYKVIIVYSTPPVLPLVPGLASMFFHTKMIFVSYDIYPEVAIRMNAVEESSIISKIMKKINNLVFKQTSKVVALSSEMKSFILNNRNIASEDIAVIPNWANDVILKQKCEVKNTLFDGLDYMNKTIISYFGNMGTAQDMATILNAIRSVKENKNIHFLFAGHGNKMDELRKSVYDEELKNVTIYDYLHGEDYTDAQSISDGFIVSLEEGLDGLCVPSKTYSYMSAGRPIISIMNPECDISRDLVYHNAGFAVLNGDNENMVKSILSLTNKELVDTMSSNCKKLFTDKFTREIATSAYADLVYLTMEEN